jgi:hypothetical protein
MHVLWCLHRCITSSSGAANDAGLDFHFPFILVSGHLSQYYLSVDFSFILLPELQLLHRACFILQKRTAYEYGLRSEDKGKGGAAGVRTELPSMFYRQMLNEKMGTHKMSQNSKNNLEQRNPKT